MFTSMQIRLERAGHCQKCEYYFRPTKQCKKCGCLVNLKVMLANTSCPVGKWGEVASSSDFISEISQSAYDFFKPKK